MEGPEIWTFALNKSLLNSCQFWNKFYNSLYIIELNEKWRQNI